MIRMDSIKELVLKWTEKIHKLLEDHRKQNPAPKFGGNPVKLN